MGLQLRVKGLVDAAKSEDRKKVIEDAAKRLVDRTGMGKEYQFMGITSRPREGSREGQVYPFVQVNDS
jgi:NADH dehydrogenase [ubiquinone] 1 alpha subcomplex assembly factor 7